MILVFVGLTCEKVRFLTLRLTCCFKTITMFQPYYFPEDAGYSVGGPYDFEFYVMQVHYNNPTLKSGKTKFPISY